LIIIDDVRRTSGQEIGLVHGRLCSRLLRVSDQLWLTHSSNVGA
jgi:hypothetical protein